MHEGKHFPSCHLYVKALYDNYERIFALLRSNGSSRHGGIKKSKRKTQNYFKLTLKWCRYNEMKFKLQSTATKLTLGDTTGFCKDIRSTNATKSKLSNAVDETEGECSCMKYDFFHRLFFKLKKERNFSLIIYQKTQFVALFLRTYTN